MAVTKQCAYCGSDFTCKPSHALKKTYCSKACMAQDYKTRLRGENNPNFQAEVSHTFVCAVCEKPFTSYGPTPKYCSLSCKGRDQSSEHYAKIGALSLGKARRQRVRTGRQNTCKHCGEVFYADGKRRYCDKCQDRSPKGAYVARDKTRQCAVCGKRFEPELKHSHRKTCSEQCFRTFRSVLQQGEKSHRWQGGKTDEARLVRGSLTYAQWRDNVFKRDNFTCQMCKRRGDKLAAHHIVPFASNPELRTDERNGITLCWPCHRSIKGKEDQYEAQFSVYVVNSADEALEVIGAV